MREVWDAIAGEAAQESDLWAEALLPSEERELVPVFSPLVDEQFALGVETIYEAYLVHFGRPRLFGIADTNTSILLGDYLYAHGLVRIAETGDVDAVAALSDLISRSRPGRRRARSRCSCLATELKSRAMLGVLPLADAASEGKDVILGMLIVGLVFLGTILLGQLAHWAAHRRKLKKRRVSY